MHHALYNHTRKQFGIDVWRRHILGTCSMEFNTGFYLRFFVCVIAVSYTHLTLPTIYSV